jgi:WD40 repeat protein
MKFPTLLLLTLLCFSTTYPQSSPVVQAKGNFGLHVMNDKIRQHKYLEEENQLLLVGWNSYQLLDLTDFRVIHMQTIDLPYSDLRPWQSDWAISPDGRRMVLTGLKEGYTKTKSETKQIAYVLDLQKGKRIAKLEHPDQIYTASWSKNGKTLMTMDAAGASFLRRTLNVSFWDGETFEFRHTITLETATWIYLSNDGERFFAASGKPKNLLGIKYVADADSVVRVWKTRDGELEDTIVRSGGGFNPKTREIEISPDEKFLVMVNKHKSSPSKHRLLVWKLEGGAKQAYELQPQPKIDASRVEFSPDGKYFALDVGKNLQIYETETGKLKVELTKVELPSWGWLNNETLANVDFKAKSLFETGKMLTAFDANNGRLLFKQRLEYAEGKGTVAYEPETIVTDDTTIRPHPTRKMFLTSSNQFVKIYDSRTGELLQTVIEPAVVVDLMGKTRKTRGNLVVSADWSKDGQTLYVFSANHQSVSLWKLIDD